MSDTDYSYISYSSPSTYSTVNLYDMYVSLNNYVFYSAEETTSYKYLSVFDYDLNFIYGLSNSGSESFERFGGKDTTEISGAITTKYSTIASCSFLTSGANYQTSILMMEY